MIIQKIAISNRDKLNLLSNFSTMISAGIPILETVNSLVEDANGNTKKILEVIQKDIIQGQQLFISFAKFPNVFDKITVNILRASEESGTMDITLKDLKAQIQREIEFNDQIKGALIYPVIIMCVFFAVMLMILTVVIPKISVVFSQLKINLPLPTKILIFLSNLILTETIPVTLGIIIVVTGFYFLYRLKKRLIFNLVFKFPVISTLVKEIDLARFSHCMHLLLTSGITITNALELSQEVVNRQDIADGIAHANEMVLAGKELSDGFKESKEVFTSIMIKIIEAGEKTGTLEMSMQEISNNLDYQVSNSLKTVTALMEPLVLVIVGILVGSIMLSIIAPIYGLIGQIGQVGGR